MRLGLYHRLRASRLYDAYWMIANPRIIESREREIRFYSTVLEGFRPGALVFDIGANHGAKTDVFLRLGARVVAVDPDEANEWTLRQEFHRLRLRRKPVVIVAKAVSDSDAVETMWVDAPGSAKNTLNRKWVHVLQNDETRFGATLAFRETRRVTTTTLDRLIEAHGQPYFIKIDVEGFESVVLRGLHQPVPYLSFEVNLPEFKPEGHECVERLRHLAPAGLFNYTSDYAVGLTLAEWQPASEFGSALDACTEPSVEVFWRSHP